MAKNAIREYSTTVSSNTDIAGIGIQGTNAVSNFDGAFRTIMKQLADVNAGTSPIDDTFSVCDPADATKKGRFDCGGITTATTRVYTLPNANGTLPLLESANIWPANQTISNSAPAINITDTDTTATTVLSGSSTAGSFIIQVDSTSVGSAPVYRVDIKGATKISISQTSADFSVPLALSTDLAVTEGGTGASTASGARTNLGLIIGANVQAWDADLDTLSTSWPDSTSGFVRVMAKNSAGSIDGYQISDLSIGLINNTTTSSWRNDLLLGASDTVTFGEVRSADDVSYSGFAGSSPNFGASTAEQGYYLTGSGLLSLSRSGGISCQMQRITSNGSIVEFYRNTAVVGSIDVTTTATTYNTSSDIRLKQDFQPINPELLDAVKVYDFEWKVDGSRGYGVIAQELNDILPNAVSKGETENGMWSVDYSKLVPLMISSLQDARDKLRDIETRLAAIGG